MDDRIYRVLVYLSNHIYGSIVDIHDIINRIFPYKKGMTEKDFETNKKLIIRFLEGMDMPKYVNFNGTRSIDAYHKGKTVWFEEGKLQVLITLEGLQAINQEKFNRSIKLNNRRQTYIIFGALFISVFSAIVSYWNYEATLNVKNVEKQYLLPSKEMLETIKSLQSPQSSRKHYQTFQGRKKDSTRNNANDSLKKSPSNNNGN